MTASRESDALVHLYRDWSARMAEEPALPLSAVRSLFDEWEKATAEPEGVTYRNEKVGGVPGLWALPGGADTTRVILYAHGGGFIAGSASSHRKLAGHLAKALGITALVLDYRRAPEHPFPAQIEDFTAAYTELLDRGIIAKNILTAGDSAGGNIAVSTVFRLREEKLPIPGGVICFSPWCDLELIGESLMTSGSTDFLVPRPSGPELVEMFLGRETDKTHPLANPLCADFAGFPPLYINVGGGEALLDDARRLHQRALVAGVDSTLSVVPGMQHVFPILAGRAAEADDELVRIAGWYSRQ